MGAGGGKGGRTGQGFWDSPGCLRSAEGVGKLSGVPMGRDGENLGLGRNSVIVEIKR